MDAILSQSDILICHGGDATIYQCLSHSIPILGLAFQSEQTWSLQRVSRMDFGEEIRLPMTADDMEKKVEFWMDQRKNEKQRFDAFAAKINVQNTQRRFREILIHLNQ